MTIPKPRRSMKTVRKMKRSGERLEASERDMRRGF
jgi:hypothetical protein